MGWFDEQLKQRKQNDDSIFNSAFMGIADVILGTKVSNALETDNERAKIALNNVLQYYHATSKDIPSNIKDINEQIEYVMHPNGIMRRNVKLSKGWFKDAMGAMIGVRKSDGTAVAFIPMGISGYCFYDTEEAKYVKVNRKNEDLFEDEAIAFYKPFPQKQLSLKSLVSYMFSVLSRADYILIAIVTLAVALLGLLTTRLSFLITGTVIDRGEANLLYSILTFMVSVTLATILLQLAKSLLMARVQTKLELTIQSATMCRLLSLPATFFKGYSSGELASMADQMRGLSEKLMSVILSSGLTSVFSLIYISQIFVYAPMLVVPAVCVLLATLIFSIIVAIVQIGVQKKEMMYSIKESGMSYAMISGIQKIKLAGAEKRAFSRWSKIYSKRLDTALNAPLIADSAPVFALIISSIGTLIMYYLAVVSKVSVAEYYAFNTAYGMISGAFMSLLTVASTIASIGPILHVVKPILEAEPEVSSGKQVLTRLSGGIELNNVSFKYNSSMPNVIDNLTLKIRPGQYVAIVGATGCGKSTLMRLLLGLETPQKGAIYYDGKDLATIDLKSLRRRVGVVMQNDKLFVGDIFENIVISAPWLSLNEAWEAAEVSGIADDIRKLPMGMQTMISEGSGGISGGQKQRLMIARAVAPKPKILMFDEATSALDNLTQKKVSESLDKLKCTRVIIAHRLSTIRQCDRVIYLEGGHIVEDGTYNELLERKGKFYQLVERQTIDY